MTLKIYEPPTASYECDFCTIIASNPFTLPLRIQEMLNEGADVIAVFPTENGDDAEDWQSGYGEKEYMVIWKRLVANE